MNAGQCQFFEDGIGKPGVRYLRQSVSIGS